MDRTSRRAKTGRDQKGRLPYQAVALLGMMILPVLLYWAARSGDDRWVLGLLFVQGAVMVLTMMVS